jgi:hypothetical protein
MLQRCDGGLLVWSERLLWWVDVWRAYWLHCSEEVLKAFWIERSDKVLQARRN